MNPTWTNLAEKDRLGAARVYPQAAWTSKPAA